MVGEAAAWVRLAEPEQAARLIAQLRGLGPDPLPAHIAEKIAELAPALEGTP